MSMDRLIERIDAMKNPSVAGLDPRLEYVPQYIQDAAFVKKGRTLEAAADAILVFNKALIDALCDVVPAIKPQAAYYEMYGWAGVRTLTETIRYAQEKGMYVMTDGKRNDIGATMTAYATAHLGKVTVDGVELEPFGADALTVNGYLGTDGIQPLLDELARVDPESAARLHPSDRRRIIRALEIYHATGMTKTEWDARSRTQSPEYQGRVLFLDYADRQQLYDRINARVDRMIALGLEQEVTSLQLPAGSTAAQAIGYKEMLEYFSGALQFDEAVEKIKTASRNYAKRQLTWFRRRPYCIPLVIEKGKTFKDIVNIALKLLTD